MQNPCPASCALLPISAIANRLGVSSFTVRRWCKEGKLKYIQSGVKVYISQNEIEKFVKNTSKEEII